jgi:hypothetical protein
VGLDHGSPGRVDRAPETDPQGPDLFRGSSGTPEKMGKFVEDLAEDSLGAVVGLDLQA